ncbi:interleukin-18 receptor 1 [Ochotona curzoniae]|uniref:interleukin-18 receptor 1 n=1 Tax=Ochotona curzoniae TaxID=130825 RepID=UPI001B34A609|nr:interleukin-18 receptor 1 [Ochotona curzoniae]XP_040849807.1 interleukin-18 receptor 1 [Ochotona curzoniae]
MCQREFLLVLLVRIFVHTSETCTSRLSITTVEGEPFYLKFCLSSEHESESNTIRWYKSNGSHGHVELNSRSSPRISLHNFSLEFWPVELDDKGSYFFHMGNITKVWKLNVIRRNKHSCFAEKQVISKTVEVEKTLKILCSSSYFQGLIHKTTLYKDCEKIAETQDYKKIAESDANPLIQKNAEFRDQGYYSCVFSIHHHGKVFNITKTFNVTILGDRNNIIPALLGPKLNYVEVELGKDIQLNCSALLNEDGYIYWNFERENGPDPNVQEENGIRIRTPEGKWFASKILRIENVNENNLNFSYNCTAVNEADVDTQRYILLKKTHGTDLPGHVFTGGMITAVSLSVIVMCLVILGIIYRVDLVLFYRRFMGRDETLTDGKMYDAFVSYLKESRPEDGEEHMFAVEVLPRVLEKHFGYKLCIFERDVMPGGAVVDEIHSLIQKSRRIIIVLSKRYMSDAVRYELESGLHEALVERKIKIILIEFTPISDFTFLPQSLKLLKSHRILKWKAEKSLSYNSRFWKNLLYLMPAKAFKPAEGELEILPIFSTT